MRPLLAALGVACRYGASPYDTENHAFKQLVLASKEKAWRQYRAKLVAWAMERAISARGAGGLTCTAGAVRITLHRATKPACVGVAGECRALLEVVCRTLPWKADRTADV